MARRLQHSVKRKVKAMEYLAHKALDLIEDATARIAEDPSIRYGVSSGERQGLPLSV